MQDDAALARLEDWFAARGWAPASFQRAAWSRFRAGESGLIHAPTGSGKTLAAWGGPVLAALARGGASPRRGPRPLRAIWITPLRALAADTHGALQSLADAMRWSPPRSRCRCCCRTPMRRSAFRRWKP